jgi:hypothetical protein
VRAVAVIAVLGGCVWALPASSRGQPAYGERLLAQYRLPADTVAQYASFSASPQLAGGSRRLQALLAEKVAWTGPTADVGVGRNPYTLVLTVSGAARVAGDVKSVWHTGWQVWESPQASHDVLIPIAGIARQGVAAGTPLTLTATSGPVSFRGERSVAPMVGLVSAENMDIHDVQLQVWSGTVPMHWPGRSASLTPLLFLGGLALLAAWAWRRRGESTAEPAWRATCILERPLEPAAAREHCEPAGTAEPAGPSASHAARIAEALGALLAHGIAVPSVPDETRRPRRR